MFCKSQSESLDECGRRSMRRGEAGWVGMEGLEGRRLLAGNVVGTFVEEAGSAGSFASAGVGMDIAQQSGKRVSGLVVFQTFGGFDASGGVGAKRGLTLQLSSSSGSGSVKGRFVSGLDVFKGKLVIRSGGKTFKRNVRLERETFGVSGIGNNVGGIVPVSDNGLGTSGGDQTM